MNILTQWAGASMLEPHCLLRRCRNVSKVVALLAAKRVSSYIQLDEMITGKVWCGDLQYPNIDWKLSLCCTMLYWIWVLLHPHMGIMHIENSFHCEECLIEKHFSKEIEIYSTFSKVSPCKSNAKCIIIWMQYLDMLHVNRCMSCSQRILQMLERETLTVCAVTSCSCTWSLLHLLQHILFDGQSLCYSYPLSVSSLKWNCLS